MQILMGKTIAKINSKCGMALNVPLPIPDESNSKFSEVNTNVYYKQMLTPENFAILIEIANEFATAGIMTRNLQVANEYYFNTGMIQYDLSRLERTMTVDNYYSYLSSADIKQRWDALFARTRRIHFLHRLVDIRIDATGIRDVNTIAIFANYAIPLPKSRT
jgi:hypothetical protein